MLVYKQLTKQVLNSRIFIILLLILTILTSASFFFVRFTIDGNINRIDEIIAIEDDAVKYQMAISSNIKLAYTFLAASIILTSFVFLIFFYRFYLSEYKQVGCLKALGFRDKHIRGYFIIFTIVLAFIGSLIGLIISYPLSDILLNANIEAYNVKGLIKSLSIWSIFLYFTLTTTIFSLVSFLSYGFIKGKETGNLISGGFPKLDYTVTLKIANKIADFLPFKNKFPFRIILRKPLTIILILIAVLSFNTFMILAYSLNISSSKVFDSQTKGRNYEYITNYNNYLDINKQNDKILETLTSPTTLLYKKTEIKYNVTGIYRLNSLYKLQDEKNNLINTPNISTAVIGVSLNDIYGFQVGDTISIKIDNKVCNVKVVSIATNAQSNTIYINGNELSKLMNLPDNSYNTLLSSLPPKVKGETLSYNEYTDILKRDAVSNKISGVINQVIGAVLGCILIFTALYMSLQDNAKDILILHLIGYRTKDIRKIFIDVYYPLICMFFLITLAPSIFIVQSIQKNLSISTGDYMPFSTNFFIILITFLVLTLIYKIVQWMFNIMLKRIIQKEEFSKYTMF